MVGQRLKYVSLVALAVAIPLSISLNHHALAATESISSPYKTAVPIKAGSIVSLDTTAQGEIVPANTNNAQQVVGVTVNDQQALFTITNSNSTQVVYEGVVNTLVSTINGNVNIGSQIAVSPVSGVGAKAIAGNKIVGIAEASLNSSTKGTISQNIYDTTHQSHKIYIGYIPVLISVNGTSLGGNNTGGFVTDLRDFVSNIAGRSISNTALLFVCVISLLALISIAVLVYSAITGGLISIGRNPLAKLSILTSLGQILVMVLIIAATSVTVIFFILH